MIYLAWGIVISVAIVPIYLILFWVLPWAIAEAYKKSVCFYIIISHMIILLIFAFLWAVIYIDTYYK